MAARQLRRRPFEPPPGHRDSNPHGAFLRRLQAPRAARSFHRNQGRCQHCTELPVGSRSPAGPISAPEIARSGKSGKTYDVIQFFGDTRIVESPGESGEYPTFESAKEAAIDYLEDAIDLCESAIDGLREAETPEQCFGIVEVTDGLSEDLGNIQFVSPGAYQPDPEIQGRPLAWFVGKTVKLRFPIPGRPTNKELLWIAVNSVRGEELVGTLDSVPLFADQCLGDEIVFGREDVLAVHEGEMAD